jgi:hypothetical protein
MATLLSAIQTRARLRLIETTARFWTDAELLTITNDGIKDLWKGIIDLYQDHFATIDSANVAAAASTAALTGVPTDVFRVIALQPRTLGESSSNKGLIFKPRTLTHPDFVQAEASRAVTPSNTVVYYAVLNAGAPVGAPSIQIAPTLSAAVNLTLKYVPVIADKTAADNNPIPGESDNALVAYTVAFARSKEREDRSPDPEWLSIYATEKRSLLVALTPRSIQEPEYAVGMFEGESYDSGYIE